MNTLTASPTDFLCTTLYYSPLDSLPPDYETVLFWTRESDGTISIHFGERQPPGEIDEEESITWIDYQPGCNDGEFADDEVICWTYLASLKPNIIKQVEDNLDVEAGKRLNYLIEGYEGV